jgi:flagellar motor switch protein FliM
MTANVVIRRKIEQSRVSVSSFPKLSVVSAAYAREAASRVRALFNTEGDVKVEANAIIRAGRYLKGLASPSVLAVLEVDGVPNSAVFHMDPRLVDHVIDLSMGGDPSLNPDASDREPTVIDLTLCRRFADSVLQAFDVAVRTVCAGKTIGGLRVTRFELQPQMVTIAPERSEVVVINQRVEIGDAPRSGFFELVLPLSVLDPIKFELMQRFGSPSRLNADLWESHLRKSLMESRLDLDAVVDRQKVPLERLLTLEVGDVLPLGKTAQDDIELTMASPKGPRLVAPVRLGAKGVQKAVKLVAHPSIELIDQLSLDL